MIRRSRWCRRAHRAIAPHGTRRSHHRRKGCGWGRVTCRRTPSRSVHGDFEVFAPIAPGLKQISFTYTLPSSAFPLVRPAAAPVSVMEVLLEESTAHAEAPRLREVDPVAIEGRTFRRFIAQDLPAGSGARVTVPVIACDRRTVYFALGADGDRRGDACGTGARIYPAPATNAAACWCGIQGVRFGRPTVGRLDAPRRQLNDRGR